MIEALLPAVAGALYFLWFANTKTDTVGKAVHAALLTAVTAVGIVELLSVARLARQPLVALVWTAVVVALAAFLVVRWHRAGRPRPRPRLARLQAYEWIGLALLVLLAAGELAVALRWLPNTQDSLTYHLARIEHWWANGSVFPYPSVVYRQVTFAPGAEYLGFTLRVLSGTYWTAPLVQWLAGIGSAAAVYRIAGQLGTGRAGRMLAAVVAGTMPMAVLQASGTSNDLTAAFFLLAFISLVLESRERGGWWLASLAGAALGLAVLTKSTAIPLAAGFGLWWMWILFRRRWTGVRSAAMAAAVAIAVAGPYLAIETAIWGSPFGPSQVDSITLDSHDPVTVAMNASKMASAELFVPGPVGKKLVCGGNRAIHKLAHRDVYDPRTEFGNNRYICNYGYDEAYAPAPLQVLLIIGAVLALLAIGLAMHRAYAVALAFSCVAFVSYVSYQPWINRLLLGAVLAGIPLVPVAVTRLRSRWPAIASIRGAIAGGIVVLVALVGIGTLTAGSPRSLSILFRDRPVDQQVLPQSPDVTTAVEKLTAAGARRIGIAGWEEFPEFGVWVLSGASRGEREIVVTSSSVPALPAVRPENADVDAVLCVSANAESCASSLPRGWRTTVLKGPVTTSVIGWNPRLRPVP
ncbi:ArnT family glycosyltransferase [Fodinicola acaciae]|uniref:ArnT family glycosyltransferase n=1 Tax=Fodinicola acaciae TaxID=2681555 RepID=UPI0013D622BF|nr:glycosyltransferase family 39 protein [Fodinicola acaciae]